MAANEVVWFSSNETGAPVLNNAAGSMIALLDACLINGFNSKSVTSLVVSAGVATATISAHGYLAGRMIDVAGVTGALAALNGRALISSIATNTVTFLAAGVPDGTATGAITTRRSPLGWTKRYSGTNKAVYARTALGATQTVLRILDDASTATRCNASMYESMTDVDTGTGNYDWYFWKTYDTNIVGAQNWDLIGDGRTFYLIASYGSNGNYGGIPCGFGDLISYRAGDAYNSFIAGNSDGTSAFGSSMLNCSNGILAGFGISRLATQVGGAVGAALISGVSGSGPSYPSPVDNGMVLRAPVMCVEANSSFANPVRGVMPGLLCAYAGIGSTLNRQTFSGITGFAGTVLFIFANGYQNQVGSMVFDLTGPWQ